MSVKHCLIVSNSGWTWQPFAVFAMLYTLMGQWLSSTRIRCYRCKNSIVLIKLSLICSLWMFCVPTLEAQWQPVQVWTSIMCLSSTGQLWDTDDSREERSHFDGHGKTPVSQCEDEALDQWVVESWITLTSFTDRRKKAAGVREQAMLLVLNPGVMCGETQKAWPTARTNCNSPASTPLREHPSPSLAWHSVYSHIHLSCPQSAAWIEMPWPWWMVILITSKNKKKIQLNERSCFGLLFFVLSPCSFVLSHQRMRHTFFFWNTRVQSMSLQPLSLSYRPPDRDSGEAGTEKGSRSNSGPTMLLFVCLLCLKQRVHGIENSIVRNSPQRLVIQRHANDIAMCWFALWAGGGDCVHFGSA